MILCINTAVPEHHVAIAGRGNNVGTRHALSLLLSAGRESETILSTIATLLKKATIKPNDLKGVAAITGPGGFTSLRIGLSVANTFAHELNIPIVGFRSDEWFAARTDEKNFLFLQSMNREEIYVRAFSTKRVHPSFVISTKQVCERAEKSLPGTILPFSKLISQKNATLYLGNLTELHLSQLPSTFKKIQTLKSITETWSALFSLSPLDKEGLGDLICPHEKRGSGSELLPFYAKEPTITKPKAR